MKLIQCNASTLQGIPLSLVVLLTVGNRRPHEGNRELPLLARKPSELLLKGLVLTPGNTIGDAVSYLSDPVLVSLA